MELKSEELLDILLDVLLDELSSPKKKIIDEKEFNQLKKLRDNLKIINESYLDNKNSRKLSKDDVDKIKGLLSDIRNNLSEKTNEDIDEKLELKVNYYLSEIPKIAFCLAVGSQKHARSLIDKIYDEDKLKYLEAFIKCKSEYKELFFTYDVETCIYAEKILGLLEIAEENNDFSNVRTLFSKAYKKVYINIKNLDTVYFHNLLMIDTEDITPVETLCRIYYALKCQNFKFKKETDNLDKNLFIKVCSSFNSLKIAPYFTDVKNKEVCNMFKKRFKHEYNIKDKNYTLEDFNLTLLAKEIGFKGKLKEVVLQEGIDDAIDNSTIGKHLSANEGFMKRIRFNTTLFKDIKLSKEDIDLLLNTMYTNITHLKFNEDEAIISFIYNTYTLLINHLYRELMQKYINFINEENVLATEKLKLELEESKRNLEKTKNDIDKKQHRIENSNIELLKEIEKLKKENKKLKLELENSEEIKSEVVKLREFVFNNNLSEELSLDEYVENLEEKIKAIKDFKIAIIGGHKTWQNNLKEILPNSSFIYLDDINKDFKFLTKMDYVFINIKIPHQLYYRVKNTIKKYNIDFDFIDTRTNIGFSINDIYDKTINKK